MYFMCNERNHSFCYTTTTYEVHTFKNKNKRKSLRDIFVYRFLFYICFFLAANFLYALFFISNTFISNAKLKLVKKIKEKLSNTLRLNFCFSKIFRFLHLNYYPKVIGGILKMYKEQVSLF